MCECIEINHPRGLLTRHGQRSYLIESILPYADCSYSYTGFTTWSAGKSVPPTRRCAACCGQLMLCSSSSDSGAFSPTCMRICIVQTSALCWDHLTPECDCSFRRRSEHDANSPGERHAGRCPTLDQGCQANPQSRRSRPAVKASSFIRSFSVPPRHPAQIIECPRYPNFWAQLLSCRSETALRDVAILISLFSRGCSVRVNQDRQVNEHDRATAPSSVRTARGSRGESQQGLGSAQATRHWSEAAHKEQMAGGPTFGCKYRMGGSAASVRFLLWRIRPRLKPDTVSIDSTSGR